MAIVVIPALIFVGAIILLYARWEKKEKIHGEPRRDSYLVYQMIDALQTAAWIGLPIVALKKPPESLLLTIGVAVMALTLVKFAIAYRAGRAGRNALIGSILAAFVELGLTSMIFLLSLGIEKDDTPIIGYLVSIFFYAIVSRLIFPIPAEFSEKSKVESEIQGQTGA